MYDACQMLTRDYLRRSMLSVLPMQCFAICGPGAFAWSLGMLRPRDKLAELTSIWPREFQYPATVILIIWTGSVVLPAVVRMRRRLFLLPITTAVIAAHQLLIAVVTMMVCYLATLVTLDWLLQLDWPHFRLAPFVVAATCALVCGVWRLAPVVELERSSPEAWGASYLAAWRALLRQSLRLLPITLALLLWGWAFVRFDLGGYTTIDIGFALAMVGGCW